MNLTRVLHCIKAVVILSFLLQIKLQQHPRDLGNQARRCIIVTRVTQEI